MPISAIYVFMRSLRESSAKPLTSDQGPVSQKYLSIRIALINRETRNLG